MVIWRRSTDQKKDFGYWNTIIVRTYLRLLVSFLHFFSRTVRSDVLLTSASKHFHFWWKCKRQADINNRDYRIFIHQNNITTLFTKIKCRKKKKKKIKKWCIFLQNSNNLYYAINNYFWSYLIKKHHYPSRWHNRFHQSNCHWTRISVPVF